MAFALNIIMTLMLINLLCFFAYPSMFDSGIIKGMSTFGYNVTNTTTGDIYITNSSDTSSITTTMFGIGGDYVPVVSEITGMVDWIRGAYGTIAWIGSFMFAGSTIAHSSGAPALLVAMITLIYGIGYIFALFEIITGR